MAANQEWYYSQNNQQYGPVSSAELKQLASTGQLSASDFIWKEGWPEWKTAGTIKGLFTQPPVIPAMPVFEPPLPAQSPPKKSKSNYTWLKLGAGGFVLMSLVLGAINGARERKNGQNTKSSAKVKPDNVKPADITVPPQQGAVNQNLATASQIAKYRTILKEAGLSNEEIEAALQSQIGWISPWPWFGDIVNDTPSTSSELQYSKPDALHGKIFKMPLHHTHNHPYGLSDWEYFHRFEGMPGYGPMVPHIMDLFISDHVVDRTKPPEIYRTNILIPPYSLVTVYVPTRSLEVTRKNRVFRSGGLYADFHGIALEIEDDAQNNASKRYWHK